MFRFLVLLLSLCLPIGCIAESHHFYAFIMHATHEEPYDEQAWNESVGLVKQLQEQCEATAHDESFEAFMASIDEAIQTIKSIFALYNNKQGLSVTTRLVRTPYVPADYESGLFIAIDSTMDNTSPENYYAIEQLMEGREGIYTPHDMNSIVDLLQIIKPVVEKTNGEIWLRVHY
jgi:hypothetical protein